MIGILAFLVALSSPDSPPEGAASLSAGEILERAIVAQGGRAIGGPVQDVTIVAEAIVYKGDSRTTLDVTEHLKLDGGREKFLQKMNVIGETDTIRATDGTVAWLKKGDRPTVLSRADFAKDLDELERDKDLLATCVRAFALENLKGEGVVFERLPDVTRDGLSSHRIRRIPGPSAAAHPAAAAGALDRPAILYIETGTHRLLGVELEEGGDDAPRRNICFWGVAKKVRIGGRPSSQLAVPWSIALYTRDGIESETYLIEVSINEGLEDSLFAKPR